MYFCLPNITNPMYIEQLIEMFHPPSRNIVRVCKQSTLLIFYSIRSGLLILPKIIDAPTQVSDILHHTVSFKFINFIFQIFHLFPPAVSTSFTSYIFRLSTLLWFGSCNHFTVACFLSSRKPKHSSSNHGLCFFNS